jgi:hypothetical protein
MTSLEKSEIVALGFLTAAVGLASAALPRRVGLADLLLCGAVFLLVQGLVRDVARLRRDRRAAAGAAHSDLRCVCVESSLGVGAIVAGSVLLFAWTPIVLNVVRVAWPLGIAALGGIGFLVKDVVFDWKERRLRRDPGHGIARVG